MVGVLRQGRSLRRPVVVEAVNMLSMHLARLQPMRLDVHSQNLGVLVDEKERMAADAGVVQGGEVRCVNVDAIEQACEASVMLHVAHGLPSLCHGPKLTRTRYGGGIATDLRLTHTS